MFVRGLRRSEPLPRFVRDDSNTDPGDRLKVAKQVNQVMRVEDLDRQDHHERLRSQEVRKALVPATLGHP